MRRLSILLALIACLVMAVGATAQTYNVLYNFKGGASEMPAGPLVQGFDGEFYGTTRGSGGAANAYGTFFKISTAGAMTILHNFTDNPAGDGFPEFTLLLSPFGSFYGTTTIFDNEFYRMTPAGAESILFHFCALPKCADGLNPDSMIWDWDMNIRVTTSLGGVNGNNGTILRLTPEGQETVVHTFCVRAKCSDGSEPSAMILATDGNYYGTTENGGANGHGTIFELGPAVPFTILYDFCSQADCADGDGPEGLIQGSDGNLYGVTAFGGTNGFGAVFKISTAGNFTVLYNLCSLPNCADGNAPSGGLVEGTDGNFYGMNTNFGTAEMGYGTLYRITPAGSFTLLHTYNNTDGATPIELVQGTDGAFYGATRTGGTNGVGTIFRMDVGLGRFIQPVLTFGRVGATVELLGTNLTGTTAVSFNGSPATIDLVTPTRIRTTVPVGATSGPITVTTPAGTLSSKGAFTVVP